MATHVETRRRFIRRMSAAAALTLVPGFARGVGQVAVPRKLGVALVGLGSYASGQLGPALRGTRHCRLAGVVSGTPAKLPRWAAEYNLPPDSLYTYDTLERIADNPAIDVIYIVTPPGTHRELVERAAKTGRHVICEKPMATRVADSEAMIAACRAAKVQLAIGYRLHFEPHHREFARLAGADELGPFREMTGANGFRLGARTWRVDQRLAGGGPLMDMGIYAIQAACMAKREAAPVAVTAKFPPPERPELFNEVEEAVRWTMEFEDGAKAEGFSSFGENVSRFHAASAKGWADLPYPAFFYQGQRLLTSRGAVTFPAVNQQAAQLDAMALCFRENRPTPVPGEMGRRDLAIIEAIYAAAGSGGRVKVAV